jgi:TonB-dependent starch-binding outer membrane protein SusC
LVKKPEYATISQQLTLFHYHSNKQSMKTNFTTKHLCLWAIFMASTTLAAAQDRRIPLDSTKNDPLSKNAIGYGDAPSKTLPNAVTTIPSKDFNQGNINDPLQLLQGKVAGLVITRAGGDPNGAFEVRLRGLSTITGNTKPLIVIDGVPNADLQTLDPNDIAQVDVLKDAASAAIYGLRGAAGVLLITTKRGQAGKMQVTYNGNYILESVARKTPVMNADEFVKNGGIDLKSDAPVGDWQAAITRRAQTHTHNLAMSGGVGATTFRVGLNYRAVQGVLLKDGFDQLNGRVNLTQKALNDKLTVTADLALTTRKATLVDNQAVHMAAIYNPTAPILGNDGSGLGSKYFQRNVFNYYNPVAILEQSHFDHQYDRSVGNFRAAYTILRGVTIASQFAITRDKILEKTFFDRDALFRGNNYNPNRVYIPNNVNGTGSQFTDDLTNRLWNLTGNYTATVGKFNLNALVGYETQTFTNQGFGAGAGNIFSNQFGVDNLAASTDFSNGLGRAQSYKNEHSLAAQFGRIHADYEGIYSFFASVRREGSTRLSENNRWGIFPAFGAAVNLDKLLKIQAFDLLKYRISYGIVGAQPNRNNMSIEFNQPTSWYFPYNGTYVPIYAPAQNENPNLRWEQTKEFNMGFDFVTKNNRVSGSFDYFNRQSKDLITELNLPVPPNFASSMWANVFQLRTTGAEFTLNYAVIQSPQFNWTTGFNAASATTTLGAMSNGNYQFGSNGEYLWMGRPYYAGCGSMYVNRIKEGERIGQIYVDNFAELDENGRNLFFDKDGKKVATRNTSDATRTLAGNALPTWTIGWNNQLKYGNFDMAVLMRGVFGHSILNGMRGSYEALDRFLITNTNVVTTNHFDPQTIEAYVSSKHVERADFVVIDNLSLGYTLPLSEKSKFSTVRIAFVANQPFMFTAYTGLSPEPRLTTDGSGSVHTTFSAGMERQYGYYRTRSFGVNVMAGF